MPRPSSFTQSIELREHSSNVFESVIAPEPMGNKAVRAFGGSTIAIAISAAYKDVPAKYHLYSVMGNFLGPAQNNVLYHCECRVIRSTKTFITREVEVSQVFNGKRRNCMVIVADFQVAEEDTLLVYSKPPSMRYKNFSETPDLDAQRQTLLDKKLITPATSDAYKSFFALIGRLLDRKPCQESFSAQVLQGMAKNIPTSQDDLSITERSSAEWVKINEPLKTSIHHLAALGFVQDVALAFLPLTHSHLFIPDVAVVSTLQFSLQVFVNDFDFNKWHLRESKTITGGEGRTYSEAQMWDEKGKLVSSMTQQCILRSHKKAHGEAKI